MKQKPNILITKNEATGIRVVSQYVTEFWECGWQPLDFINDKGLDGKIIMRKGGKDLGVEVNVQVKCGVNYISSEDKNFIKISISNDLLDHINYWKIQQLPTVLVFVVPVIPKRDKHGNVIKTTIQSKTGKSRQEIVWKESRLKSIAYWVDLKDPNSFSAQSKTIIIISKKNRFGEHSKGEFIKLVRPFLTDSKLIDIIPDRDSKKLLSSENLRVEARAFYKEWKNISNGSVECKSLNNANIIISRTGWNHITSKDRGKERRAESLRLLGIARQMITEVPNYFLLQQTENTDYIEQKIGLRANLISKGRNKSKIQVIILRRKFKNKTEDKLWFYSIHHRN